MRQWLIVLCLLLVAMVSAEAQETKRPIVRVEVTPPSVTVGQAIRLRITVLVPTWFRQPPVFPAFELPNASLRLPPDSSFTTNERIGGETWSGIVRDYQVYPQVSGKFRLTDQRIKVTYAHPITRKKVTDSVSVPEINFRGTIPRGAKAITPFFAARALKLTQKIEGAPEKLEVGDAIVRTVTAEVEGVPVMFVPALIKDRVIEFSSRYAKEPVVEEKGAGAEITGSRTETVTYIFSQSGRYSLPAISVRWWNINKGEPATANVPSIVVTVGSGVVSSSIERTNARPSIPWNLAILVLAAFLLLGAAYYIGPRLLRWSKIRLDNWRQTESHAFRRLLGAARRESSALISSYLTAWLARLSPGMSATRLAAKVDSEELNQIIRRLGAAAFGRETSEAWLNEVMRRRLVFELRKSRRIFLKHRNVRRSAHPLPPLNPTQANVSS